jgi:CRP/FNR family transcriptional regulator, cyclic AMP receptor protein
VNADDLLRLVASEPRQSYAAGDVLISAGELHPSVFVVAEGAFHVERDGHVLALLDEPGSIIGEISLLLETPASANVVAVEDSIVHRVDDAQRLFDEYPDFARFIAQVLARRLSRVTSYIDDVYRQFEHHGGTLGLVPQVLDDLLGTHRTEVDAGSEREPDSPY